MPGDAPTANKVMSSRPKDDRLKNKVRVVIPILESPTTGETSYSAHRRYARSINAMQHAPKRMRSKEVTFYVKDLEEN